MAFDERMRELFNSTASIEDVASVDEWNNRTYATGATFDVRVVRTQQRVIDFFGNETTSHGELWIAPTKAGVLPTVGPDMRVTLANGDTPLVLAVAQYPDEDGDHHIKVFFGETRSS